MRSEARVPLTGLSHLQRSDLRGPLHRTLRASQAMILNLWGSKITSSSAPQLVVRGERPMTSAGSDFALAWWARCCIRRCASGWT